MTPTFANNDEPPSSVTLDYQRPIWTDNDVELEIQTPLSSKRLLEDVQLSHFLLLNVEN